MPNVLLVDDDISILEINELYLRHKGYTIRTAASGTEAIQALTGFIPHCVVLDIRLPDISGLLLCQSMKERTSAPIIFLSCLDSEDDRVSGFTIGADDYVTKPFSPKELECRIHARIRASVPKNPIRYFGRLSINTMGDAFVDDKPLNLTSKESALLHCLSATPNKTFSTEFLFSNIWQLPANSDLRVVQVHISNLRKKLARALGNDSYIETVWGGGYRFRWHDPD